MRWHKNNLLAFVLDLALVAFGWWLTFWLRFNLDIPDEFQAMMVDTLPWPLLGFGTSLLVWGVYRHIWRYTSVAELTRLVYGVVFAGLLSASAVLMLRVGSFPRSVLLLHPMLVLLLLGLFLLWRIDSPRVERFRSALIDRFVPSFEWAMAPVTWGVGIIGDF